MEANKTLIHVSDNSHAHGPDSHSPNAKGSTKAVSVEQELEE